MKEEVAAQFKESEGKAVALENIMRGQRVSISIDGAKKRKCEDEKEDQPDVKKNKHMAKQRQKPNDCS